MDLSKLSRDLELSSERDFLFLRSDYPKPFEFNFEVAQVFDDMVSRSVPLYHDINHMILQWTYLHYQLGTQIIDVGCSTGTTLNSLCENLPYTLNITGIDYSQAMIDRAQEKLQKWTGKHSVTLLCQRADKTAYTSTSIVILNFVLQFIPVRDRLSLLSKIYREMNPGGMVFVSEKIRFASGQFQETVTKLYENFKKSRGYSKSEIARKKESLDQVLTPLTSDEHHTMFRTAGFSSIEPVLQWHNFKSWILIK